MEVRMHGRGRNSEPPGDTQHLPEHEAEACLAAVVARKRGPARASTKPARDSYKFTDHDLGVNL